MVGQSLLNFLKIFSVGLTITKFLFLPSSGILKISMRKKERVICHEGLCKLDNLFKPIVTNTLISLENQVNSCYQGKMHFLNLSDASLDF